MCCKSSVHRKNIISYCYSKVNIISYCYSKVNEHMSKIYSMLYQTHAFDAKLDHNGCVWYIRLIFNGYCFVGDAVFCQCRICRFSLCAGSKDDVSGVPFSFRHIAFIELFLISYFYYLETFLDKVGRELPQLFKVAVAVEDGRKIFGRVVVFERLHGDERDKDRKQRPCRSFYGGDLSEINVFLLLLAPFLTCRGMNPKTN